MDYAGAQGGVIKSSLSGSLRSTVMGAGGKLAYLGPRLGHL